MASLLESDENFVSNLSAYVQTHQSANFFLELQDLKIRRAVWEKISQYLGASNLSNSDCHILLDGVRILSREKEGLDEVVSRELMVALGRIAKLQGDGCMDTNKVMETSDTIIRAQKAIFNLVFNSVKAREIFLSLQFPQAIMERLRNLEAPHEMRFFDIRILFLVSALLPAVRGVLKDEANGVESLTQLLAKLGHVNLAGKEPTERISDKEAELFCEASKLLFNITMDLKSGVKDPDLSRLVSYLRMILIQNCESEVRRKEVKSQCVCLLTNIPVQYMDNLYLLDDASEDRQTDMTAIDAAVDLLDQKLNCPPERSIEELTPILKFFCEICANHSPVRKRVRSAVLPPMRSEVLQRPEDGNTMRNRLVKLMTAASRTQVSQSTAHFLFVLCKENVGRLIKYTGYGNAAGLLAANGLMWAPPGNGEQYSDDSESSDTEEYKMLESEVNPITCRVERPHANPFEGMSEEQKEYEAMKLVNLMDKMNKSGLIQPCRIGEDGKPHPVDHVLELRQELDRPLGRSNDDSDDD